MSYKQDTAAVNLQASHVTPTVKQESVRQRDSFFSDPQLPAAQKWVSMATDFPSASPWFCVIQMAVFAVVCFSVSKDAVIFS